MSETIFGAAEQFKHEPSVDREFPSAAFTRVPACYIGKIANGEKTAAAALHLAAYKLSRGGGWVLNKVDARKVLGMGWRAFQGAIAHLIRANVLNRSQPNHRDFAHESLEPRTSAHCVNIADRVIKTQSSSVVAFVLAANLSPTARTPAEIALKIGIKSRDTARKAVSECVRLGAIEVFHDTTGKAWICRPGDAPKKGVAKIGVAKNGATKNGVAQRNKTEDQRNRQKNKKAEKAYLSAEADRSALSDLIALPDWKHHPAVQDLMKHDGWRLEAEPPRRVIGATIIDLVAARGARAAAHLVTPSACQQIAELAACAAANAENPEADFEKALCGVCNLIAVATARGKIIRSLSFIALPVLKASHCDESLHWATHGPSAKLGASLQDWRAWAEKVLMPAIEAAGTAYSHDGLTASGQIEVLADLCTKYGAERVQQACARSSPGAGLEVCAWSYFTQFLPQGELA